ncbi:hypothetical protein G7054_g1774 [Neopestalotiopsis clavispora]|nr:hypothetical protein G7054_g1774 [Neopestalotiopsis clavispora]
MDEESIAVQQPDAACCRKASEPTTPRTGHEILDMAIGKSPKTRRLFRKVAKAVDKQRAEAAELRASIERKQKRIDQLRRSNRRRKARERQKRLEEAEMESDEDGFEDGGQIVPTSPYITRYGRAVKVRRMY